MGRPPFDEDFGFAEFVSGVWKSIQTAVNDANRDRGALMVLQSFLTPKDHPQFDKIMAKRDELLKEMDKKELERIWNAATLMQKEVKERLDVHWAADHITGRTAGRARTDPRWAGMEFPPGYPFQGDV